MRLLDNCKEIEGWVGFSSPSYSMKLIVAPIHSLAC
jgi:hypothetical protein